MENVVKATLILMGILTVIYAGAVAYVNANSSLDDNIEGDLSRAVLYAAFEYESETPPSVWYTPEQLGITGVIRYGENCSWLHIGVDREKEPFPLQREQPIFLYKDKFYKVSHLWVTPAGCDPNVELIVKWLFGLGLGLGWVFTGILLLNGRRKE